MMGITSLHFLLIQPEGKLLIIIMCSDQLSYSGVVFVVRSCK